LRGVIGGNTSSSGVTHPTSVTVNGTPVRINKLLGEGGYAYVFAATRTGADGTSRSVALKRFVVRDADALSSVLSEIELLRALSPHPRIVAYVDHQRVSSQKSGVPAGGSAASRSSLLPSEEDVGAAGDVWLVMEMAAGSLRAEADRRIADFQKEKGSSSARLAPFTAAEIRRILADVCEALAQVHGMRPPVAHNDLKLENILMTSDGRYQLCDFGSARPYSITCKTALQVNKAEALLDATMTVLYRPPEACDLWQGITVDTQADTWAMGVMLYSLLAGAMPFDANPRQVLAVQYEPLSAELRANADFRPLCDLCTQGLLVQDPAQRLNLDGLTTRLHEIDPATVPQPTRLGDVRRVMPPMPA
jgi:AP2-associated kinase